MTCNNAEQNDIVETQPPIVPQAATPSWEQAPLAIDNIDGANGLALGLFPSPRENMLDAMITVRADPLKLFACLREFVADVLCAHVEVQHSAGQFIQFKLFGMDVPLRVEIEVASTGPVCMVFAKHLSRSDTVGFHKVCRTMVRFLSSKEWQVSAPGRLRSGWELLPFDDDEEEP